MKCHGKKYMKKNILILPRAHIGDFIWATSAISIIRKRNNDATITILLPSNLKKLLDSSIFDEAVFYNLSLFDHSNKLFRIIYKLFLFVKFKFCFFYKKFDECFFFSPPIVLTKMTTHFDINNFIFAKYECCGHGVISQESIILKNAVNIDKIKEIDSPQNSDYTHYSEIFQTTVRGYYGITDIALPVLPAISASQKTLAMISTLKNKKIAVCLRGYINNSTKNYPLESFKYVISEISKHISSAFYLVGSQEQEEIAKDFIYAMKTDIEIHNLCGKTDLIELKQLLSGMDLLISVDTGIPHIAATTGINMITLFGFAAPDAVMPMSSTNISIYKKIECSPCIYNMTFQKQTCPYAPESKCMKNISPNIIVKEALKILKQ